MILFVSLYTKAFHSHKVEKYLVIFVTSTKWKPMQKETGNCGNLFSIKVEIIVIFYFDKTENVTAVNYIFTKWKGI